MNTKKENAAPGGRPVLEELKFYAATRIKLLKYETIDSASVLTADIVCRLVFAACLVLSFLFFIVGGAFYLANLLHSYWAGFGCAALLVLLITLLIYMFKKRLEVPLVNGMIRKLFK